MKKTLAVIRNGEKKLHLPNFEVRSDLTIWSNGKNRMPLIDSEATESKRLGKEELNRLAAARKFSEIPESCFAKYGENESGLIVMDAAEHLSQIRAAAKAAMTPAQIERIEINKLFAEADQIANGDSDDNVWLPMHLRSKANGLLKTWREKYETEANQEKASDLRDQADQKRELASGALVYDADGWLSDADQQKRHDDFIAEAIELEKQADVLTN